jgi:HK97 family phage portal protein
MSLTMNVRSALSTAVSELRSYWQGPFNLNSPNTPLSAFWGDGARTGSGVAVNESSALGLTPVWSAVQLIAGTISTLPVICYERRPDGSRRRLPDHPLHRVLHDRANPEMSAVALRQAVVTHALLTGNGYCEIIRDSVGRVQALYLLEPDRVVPFRPALAGGRFGPLTYKIDGQVDLAARFVFHLSGLVTWDGVCGKSVVQATRESLGLSIAAERMGGAYFANGAHPSGFLKFPGKLTKDGRAAVRESLAARHEGAANASKTLILEDGLEYQSVGLSNEDSQFIQTRGFQVAEVARMFSIPPPRLGDYSKANYSNIEQAAQDFVQALRPWTVKFEQEVSLKLAEQPAIYVEHLFDALLRADTKTRFEAYRQGREGGWLSANDIRKMESMEEIVGGDSYLVPLNHSTVGGPAAPAAQAARAALVDAVERFARREAEHAKKNLATPSRFGAWLSTHPERERDHLLGMMRAPIRTYLACIARERLDVEALAGQLVDRFFAQTQRELNALVNLEGEALRGGLDRRLLVWDRDHRASVTVDAWIAEINERTTR